MQQLFAVQTLIILLLIAPRFITAAPAPVQLSPKLVPTDLLVDDLGAILALVAYYKEAGLEDKLMFVTTDEEVEGSAPALRNFLDQMGAHRSLVVNGSQLKPTPLDYQAPYLERRSLIRTLSAFAQGDWSDYSDDRRHQEILNFLKANQGDTDLLLCANPGCLGSSILKSPEFYKNLNKIYAMGLWKSWGANFITAYNSNIDLSSLKSFMGGVAMVGKVVTHLPSDMAFFPSDVDQDAFLHAYQKLLSSENLTKDLLKALTRFRDKLDNELVKNYGPNAGFIFSFDPETALWTQDIILAAIALAPDSIEEAKRVFTQISEKLQTPPLGYGVNLEENERGYVSDIRKLDYRRIIEVLSQTHLKLSGSEVTSLIDDIDLDDPTPIAIINKAAIDDIGMLLSLHKVKDRVGLIIAESTNTEYIASVYRSVLGKLGDMEHTKVVAGKGHDLEKLQLQAFGLEKQALVKGELGVGFLDQETREDLARVNDTSDLDASEDLIRYLEDNPLGVDLILGSTLKTINQVLDSRPDLGKHVRKIYVMGGGRTDASQPEWLSMSRNWVASPEDVKVFFALVEKHKIETTVFSSDSLGGAFSANQMEGYQEMVERSSAPVIKGFEQYRAAFTAVLNDLLNIGLNPKTNMGPPLAYGMANFLLLGDRVGRHFNRKRVRVEFHPKEATLFRFADAFDSHSSVYFAQSHLGAQDMRFSALVEHLLRQVM